MLTMTRSVCFVSLFLNIYVIVDHQWWTNGYKGGGDDVWMWPIDRGDFSPGSSDAYSNWLPGNVSFSSIVDV